MVCRNSPGNLIPKFSFLCSRKFKSEPHKTCCEFFQRTAGFIIESMFHFPCSLSENIFVCDNRGRYKLRCDVTTTGCMYTVYKCLWISRRRLRLRQKLPQQAFDVEHIVSCRCISTLCFETPFNIRCCHVLQNTKGPSSTPETNWHSSRIEQTNCH